MRLTSKLMEMVENGREGNNMGLSTGLPKLDGLIYGVQRKWFYLVCGGSGAGFSFFMQKKIVIFVFNIKNIKYE